jgi:small-conductance mechanosensitive channel
MVRGAVRCGLAAAVVLAVGVRIAAQPQTPAVAPPGPALLNTTPSDQPFTFTYFNRPIVQLKANVLGRTPVERAIGAQRALDDLASQGTTGPVALQPADGIVMISVGARVVLALTPADVDNLSGETLQGVSAQALARLQQALDEVQEAHRPMQLFRASAMTVGALCFGLIAWWAIYRSHRALAGRLAAGAERTIAKSKLADIEVIQGLRLIDFERRLVTATVMVFHFLVAYWVVTFGLRQFPYTRPWGESLRGFLVATVENIGLGIARALPGLFTVLLIVLLTRFLIRVVSLWFTSVERGRVRARWIYPETAQPTRRLVTVLLWLFAVVVSYPYLPGSQTDAFKGVSVFVGLIVSLGSSGLISQIMSGFMITYSRSLRLGDFVRIGDVEGTVQHLGVLSTKVRTLRNEDVTIPNALVVSQTTTDYSRFGDTEGVFTATSVTIGYDTPWRQVHALLLQAAERTEGIRREPKPVVLQAGLEDFYVKYTLFVCLERQQTRPFTLNALHANIQDAFNEYGVQIMSPNYVLDPAAPKVVQKKDWFAAPGSAQPRS